MFVLPLILLFWFYSGAVARLIWAVLAGMVVTLVKFNYSQTSGVVEKSLEDGFLMS